MGIIVGRPACPDWFWEEWHAKIYDDGNFQFEVSNGSAIVARESGHLGPQQLTELMDFVQQRLLPGTREVGQFATDTDYGEVVVNSAAGTAKLRFQDYNADLTTRELFYAIVHQLEQILRIPNPYC